MTPAPVEPSGPKGRRRKGPGRTDYLLCVQVGDMPKALPVAVLEAKKEAEDPLKGMQQAKGYADCAALRREIRLLHQRPPLRRVRLLHRADRAARFRFADFPPHPDLTARYAKDTGIDLDSPEAAMLFQADSPAWSQSRYYQDAAIRAAFEKIILDRQAGTPPRVLLTLATGAGKTIIATNLLWRLTQAGQLAQARAVPLRPRRTARTGLHQAQGRLRRQRPHRRDRARRERRARMPASTSPPTRRWAWTMTTKASPAS